MARQYCLFVLGSDTLGIIASSFHRIWDRHILIGRMEPDFLELSRVSCVVYMTMGVYYNYGFVGNPLHRTAEIADAHPGINQHGFLCTNEKKQTCYIKFINFPYPF